MGHEKHDIIPNSIRFIAMVYLMVVWCVATVPIILPVVSIHGKKETEISWPYISIDDSYLLFDDVSRKRTRAYFVL